MLTMTRRSVWNLRISLDTKYPGIIAQARQAIFDVSAHRPGESVRTGCVEVYSYWKHWLCLFPQHGPGPTHERPMHLAAGQSRLVTEAPDTFLAGLIHSDGCRCMNRVYGREYPRYFFSNLSDDIRGLFASTCALVGVDCRPAGRQNVSIARRTSVEIMDRLVGPKT
jgi:hypothetical protein